MLARAASSVRPAGLRVGFRNLSRFEHGAPPQSPSGRGLNAGDLSKLSELKPPPAKWLAAAAVGTAALYAAKNSVLMADAGIVYVIQNRTPLIA